MISIFLLLVAIFFYAKWARSEDEKLFKSFMKETNCPPHTWNYDGGHKFVCKICNMRAGVTDENH